MVVAENTSQPKPPNTAKPSKNISGAGKSRRLESKEKKPKKGAVELIDNGNILPYSQILVKEKSAVLLCNDDDRGLLSASPTALPHPVMIYSTASTAPPPQDIYENIYSNLEESFDDTDYIEHSPTENSSIKMDPPENFEETSPSSLSSQNEKIVDLKPSLKVVSELNFNRPIKKLSKVEQLEQVAKKLPNFHLDKAMRKIIATQMIALNYWSDEEDDSLEQNINRPLGIDGKKKKPGKVRFGEPDIVSSDQRKKAANDLSMPTRTREKVILEKPKQIPESELLAELDKIKTEERNNVREGVIQKVMGLLLDLNGINVSPEVITETEASSSNLIDNNIANPSLNTDEYRRDTSIPASNNSQRLIKKEEKQSLQPSPTNPKAESESLRGLSKEKEITPSTSSNQPKEVLSVKLSAIKKFSLAIVERNIKRAKKSFFAEVDRHKIILMKRARVETRAARFILKCWRKFLERRAIHRILLLGKESMIKKKIEEEKEYNAFRLRASKRKMREDRYLKKWMKAGKVHDDDDEDNTSPIKSISRPKEVVEINDFGMAITKPDATLFSNDSKVTRPDLAPFSTGINTMLAESLKAISISLQRKKDHIVSRQLSAAETTENNLFLGVVPSSSYNGKTKAYQSYLQQSRIQSNVGWEELARVDNIPSMASIRNSSSYKSPAYKALEKISGLTEADIHRKLDTGKDIAALRHSQIPKFFYM